MQPLIDAIQTTMHYAAALAGHGWALALEAAPWLLLGLLIAAVLKAYLPDRLLTRLIGGRGLGAIGRAAVIGAPLPLCSCGVMPAALGLRRQGASPGGTVSFLVATPETGVDSVAVSYALLGPLLTIVRPIAAIVSAVVAGLSCQLVADRFGPWPGRVAGGAPDGDGPAPSEGPSAEPASGCCSETNEAPATGDGCCDTGGEPAAPAGLFAKLRQGLRYTANELMDEIWVWMLVGILAAAAVRTFIPPDSLATWGSGLAVMLLMLGVGIPMYICATASTPLAAAMLAAGMSPGTVLVFLLAGPATNVATMGLVRRELGSAVLVGYLGSMAVTTLALGLATDGLLLGWWGFDFQAQALAAAGLVPSWLAVVSLVALVLLAIRPLRRALL
jgi:uncharacterized membrane protein YraQ (UPF0718 family)